MSRARKAADTTVGAARSKLMWLGLAVLVMGQLQEHKDLLDAIVPPKYQGAVYSLLGIAIMVARFFTTESLTNKGAKKP
jgi:hypothetical protein